MIEAVTFAEISSIFEITDRLGVHREQLVIPLAPRHPGHVRRTPAGKIEIVVDAQAEFAAWLAELEMRLRELGVGS